MYRFHRAVRRLKSNSTAAKTARSTGPTAAWANGGAGIVQMKAKDALEPVLRDIRATGVPVPTVQFTRQEDKDLWLAILTASDESSHGFYIDLSLTRAQLVCSVAESTQEWVFDEMQSAGRTNWPLCPLHPRTHPLKAVVAKGIPQWACPSENIAISEIGDLEQDRTAQ